MTTLEPRARRRRVQYPESDGKPLGETDLHINLMFELTFALKWYLRNVRADNEAQARQAAEQRTRELEAELRRLRGEE